MCIRDSPDSLSSDDSKENTLGPFSSGIFVINEGNFGSDDGSISFIDPNGLVQNNIFSENNALRRLGDVVQSMYAIDTSAFILVNSGIFSALVCYLWFSRFVFVQFKLSVSHFPASLFQIFLFS